MSGNPSAFIPGLKPVADEIEERFKRIEERLTVLEGALFGESFSSSLEKRIERLEMEVMRP